MCCLFSYCFRRTSLRPGSHWEATPVLLNRLHSSWGILRCLCCHLRALLGSAVTESRRPSRLWPHSSSNFKFTWNSSKTRVLCIHTCPHWRWSSSKRVFWANSWWWCPLSRQRAMWSWSVSTGTRLSPKSQIYLPEKLLLVEVCDCTCKDKTKKW